MKKEYIIFNKDTYKLSGEKEQIIVDKNYIRIYNPDGTKNTYSRKYYDYNLPDLKEPVNFVIDTFSVVHKKSRIVAKKCLACYLDIQEV